MRMFPGHTINRVASSLQKGASDIVMEKDGFPKILVEVKMYKTTVNKSEVLKMERDVTLAKAHGLFVSHTSRIQGKPNFHIDIIQEQYIVVYLSNTQFDMEPIMSAVSTIYELDSILKKYTYDADGDTGLRLDQDALAQISSILEMTQKNMSDIEKRW
ncbi:hypothetical protein GGF32_006369 [Allomyces javanicus]|nr:hypothetical protein GGF32_006369 [Allomyces javanicus]